MNKYCIQYVSKEGMQDKLIFFPKPFHIRG